MKVRILFGGSIIPQLTTRSEEERNTNANWI